MTLPPWLIAPSADDLPVGQVHVGIVGNADGGWHVALLYRLRLSASFAWLLHLAGDQQLYKDEQDHEDIKFYCWVKPALAPEQQLALALLCGKVAEKNLSDSIRFGFTPPIAKVQDDGKMLLGSTDVGLTCASFVMSLFSKIGVTLLDLENWPSRKQDEQFISGVGKNIKKVDEAHGERILAAIAAAIRCRPPEVAGASSSPNTPLKQADAEKVASVLLSALGNLPKSSISLRRNG
ncbi:MAG: hypothetical protein IPG45_30130 [Deltaproteobacteria bacterium]|nr:hypothetical protein [Deltaproteobacteria bacterium]